MLERRRHRSDEWAMVTWTHWTSRCVSTPQPLHSPSTSSSHHQPTHQRCHLSHSTHHCPLLPSFLMTSTTRAMRAASVGRIPLHSRSMCLTPTPPIFFSLVVSHRLPRPHSTLTPSVSTPYPSTSARSFSRLIRSTTSSGPSSSSVLPPTFPCDLALRLLRACWTSTRVPSLELVLNLNLDPRKQAQTLRGTAALPHGTGQRIRIGVFARGDKAKEAVDAGADVVGAEDLVQRITQGDIPFDRCIATPDCMALVGRVARVLGPRGLMPNPKMGTVTLQVREAVRTARQGQVTFKTEKGGVLHVQCGKLSFTHQQLTENVAALVKAVVAARPAGAKGNLIRGAFLHSTHSPSVPLDLRQEPFRVQTVRPQIVRGAIDAPPSPPAEVPVQATQRVG